MKTTTLIPQQQHQLQNAQQVLHHQEQQDLLTSNPVLPQAGHQPRWPATTSTSPAASGMLTAANAATASNQGAASSVSGSNNAQNWINSRPNSSSIHTPSPTSAQQPQPLMPPPSGSGHPPGGGGAGRLPPPLAPTTTHQPPSSQPPPAYTPPTQQHLSNTGFQASPHSSSWRYVQFLIIFWQSVTFVPTCSFKNYTTNYIETLHTYICTLRTHYWHWF